MLIHVDSLEPTKLSADLHFIGFHWNLVALRYVAHHCTMQPASGLWALGPRKDWTTAMLSSRSMCNSIGTVLPSTSYMYNICIILYIYIYYIMYYISTHVPCTTLHTHTRTITYIHIHTQTYTFSHIRTHRAKYRHIQSHTNKQTYHIHTYLPTYPPTYIPTYLPTCMHACMHACMCKCICVYYMCA